ncbi:hypothetical protein MIMGU_mgv1a023945mg [Erythranthe guttata]|uniref:GIL1/IRKI C-terminal domain-containing protein n=1 Tax=Erythranthe guttata TaxID=4155 RepID=A0A022S219_ERYGU|nr:hypothetical protein MIMGU_mgv1a023945mg [Erythranthe guttata]
MAAAITYQEEHGHAGNGESGRHRRDIQAAFAKAAELQALHAAANLSLPSASPVSRRLSSQDYPVFTPVSICLLPCLGFSQSDRNSRNPDNLSKNSIKSNVIAPSTDSHSSLHSQSRNKGTSLSWLFPKLKTKTKNETLRKELIEAKDSRDSALIEVAETKSSLGELGQKLEYLETYCEELKRALKQTVEIKNTSADNPMPVSDEVMVEGFLQIVSEARISVNQLCKTILGQIGDQNEHNSLNSLLKPYKLSLHSKNSKLLLCHLEAIVNQSLYQDFENCSFRKNGSPSFLDPHEERRSRFELFVKLRNLSWEEVLRKGTRYYSEEFSRFCDQKMSGIVGSLGWNIPWPEDLLRSFFVAGKCVWLLHLLAFSFYPNLGILRVDENRSFDGCYMEDVFGEKQRKSGNSCRVKIMVMPGFYVHDQVIKCKVLCRYK